ncbi:MAG: gliding motility-associated C-terminal domain-containing protein [Cyclobacteriaceae bacterium]|nr:gliding motility-associated C-terminal domain-containing protein [Cyclobacteriaceae bacterium]
MRYLHGILLALCLMIASQAGATHLRAGEITIRRVNCTSLTFQITITVYTNTGSDIQFGQGLLDFGDGTTPHTTPTIPNTVRTDLGANIGTVSYTTNHTYAGIGRFIISYLEPNRNAGIQNMFNSVETRFYMESQINIDPFLGCDNSPVLLVPPIDKACTGAAWYHNPGAYDPDGDSLSYELTIPKKEKDLDVNNYRDPNVKEFYDKIGLVYSESNEDGNGPPTFEINPVTGTLIWDAPGAPGEYNIAFVVLSWRKISGIWINQGFVVRDMQIIVEDCENQRPELIVPPDICVVAGTTINKDIFGTDPDFDKVKIEVFSEILSIGFQNPASYNPNDGRYQVTSPMVQASVNFTWDTKCLHVKDQPYQVVFKITDDPPPGKGAKLVQFKTWNITVVGPPPTWNTIQVQPGRKVKLGWNPYTFLDESKTPDLVTPCTIAQTMQVWRRIEGNPFTPPECVTGMPESLGYTKIKEVPISQITFTDNNNGAGLAPGTKYCYRLVAKFPLPEGGESYVSQDICETILADAPMITNVTVDKTDVTNGEVTVRWRPPFEIDQGLFPPPYRYKVSRAEGFTGDLRITNLFTNSILDTVYTDIGVNTTELTYNYRVVLFDGNGTLVDTSALASSVRLDPKPQFKRIELNWTADVPWSNQSVNFPRHFIYRGPEGATEADMVLIDDVEITSGRFVYIDSGQFNGVPLSEEIIYCYRIETRGTYGNPRIIEPLINFSQINCAQPNDSIAPCKPALSITAKTCAQLVPSQSCEVNVFSNTLTWRKPEDEECRQDIRGYNIYTAPYVGAEFTLYAESVRDTFYIDSNLPSYAKCYKISAVDRAGNESELSEQFCFDNCPHYELPNVFTPNGDHCNELFSAYSSRQIIDENGEGPCGPVDLQTQRLKCARFVEKVEFVVTNRWGKHVYDYESGGERSIYIDWDGRDNSGNELAAGVYYYDAKVTFTVVDPSQRTQHVRGWVQIVR